MLSDRLNRPDTRASEDRPSKYAVSSTRQTCDECLAVQHETAGAGVWTRRTQQYRRTLPAVKGKGSQRDKVIHAAGPSLALCSGHAAEWKTRDEDDGVVFK